MEVITLCGSMKFKTEMMLMAQKLTLNGYLVLTPFFQVEEQTNITLDQLKKLKEAHLKRIELSDSILVMNIGGYIGESTESEIQYAKKLNKKIIYYTDLLKETVFIHY